MLRFESSFRRFFVDKALYSTDFSGDVLDVGGKKQNKRGSFIPPESKVGSWTYLNIDKSTNPDLLASADDIPKEDNSFDHVLMCEVLEHLESPKLAIKEASRVLKSSGTFTATVPFLYAEHADPHDYQRWTKTKLHKELSNAGFNKLEITPMGGVFSVIYDLLRFNFRGKISRGILKVIRPIIFFLDSKFKSDHSCTGYFIQAKK